MITHIKLLHCPFCGGKPEFVCKPDVKNYYEIWVACEGGRGTCKTVTDTRYEIKENIEKSKYDLAKEWNTRYSVPSHKFCNNCGSQLLPEQQRIHLPIGWNTVPIELTHEMIEAAGKAHDEFVKGRKEIRFGDWLQILWESMVIASPHFTKRK